MTQRTYSQSDMNKILEAFKPLLANATGYRMKEVAEAVIEQVTMTLSERLGLLLNKFEDRLITRLEDKDIELLGEIHAALCPAAEPPIVTENPLTEQFLDQACGFPTQLEGDPYTGEVKEVLAND